MTAHSTVEETLLFLLHCCNFRFFFAFLWMFLLSLTHWIYWRVWTNQRINKLLLEGWTFIHAVLSFFSCLCKKIYIYTYLWGRGDLGIIFCVWWGHSTTVGGGGNRNFRVMSAFQAAAAAGFQAGGVGSTFPSAATFPHYAIQQGIPYNLYGYVCSCICIYICIWYLVMFHPFLSLSPPLERCTCFANSCTPSSLILGLHFRMLIHHNPLSLSLSLSPPFWCLEQHMQEQLINEKRNELPDFHTLIIYFKT